MRIIRAFYSFVMVTISEILFSYIWFHRFNTMKWVAFEGKGNYMILFINFVVFLLMLKCFNGHKLGFLKMTNLLLSDILIVLLTNFIMCVIVILLIGQFDFIWAIIMSFINVTLINCVLFIINTLLFKRIYDYMYPTQKVLLIYENYSPDDFLSVIDKRKDRIQCDRCICIKEGFEEVVNEALQSEAVLLYDINSLTRNELLKRLLIEGIPTYYTSKISDEIISSSENTYFFDTPLMAVRDLNLTLFECFVKRLVDIIFSFIILLVLSPIMIITGVAIKLYDKGPVFFKQERVTKDGKRFNIVKFRSMIVNAEPDGKSIPSMPGDSRITPVGNFIRKTRIDEIPQFFNVLKGDMSIVGPRPERVEHVEKYTKQIPEFSLRTKVKGGITGYAQIYGKYNTSAYDKLKLDLNYIMNYSILLDLQIIVGTIKVVFMRESTEGFSTNDEKNNS